MHVFDSIKIVGKQTFVKALWVQFYAMPRDQQNRMDGWILLNHIHKLNGELEKLQEGSEVLCPHYGHIGFCSELADHD